MNIEKIKNIVLRLSAAQDEVKKLELELEAAVKNGSNGGRTKLVSRDDHDYSAVEERVLKAMRTKPALVSHLVKRVRADFNAVKRALVALEGKGKVKSVEITDKVGRPGTAWSKL